MAKIRASGVVTRKGQVTIPIDMRRSLGIEEGDRVDFILEDGGLQLVRASSFAERTAGIFHVPGMSLTIEEMKEAAAEAWIEDAVKRQPL